jgi:hypothetical protein
MNQALVFGLLGVGGLLLVHAVTGSSFADILQGHVTPPSTTGAQLAGGGVASLGTALSGALSPAGGGFPAAVNPVPGAVGSRLDQGFDATGHTFLSPWTGTVVVSQATSPGWAGGGYLAIQSNQDPSKVYYLAEGILPSVQAGEQVTAGQTIATPAINPYNGIEGNVEFGLANPQSPGQPLAQTLGSKAASMVEQFASWIESLGGPHPTSTSNAGSA